ncbi:MAG: threonine/serine dehydratase [Armatimonadetes bacterium]|nr:threonine/serine dehydratase [Armatimonadota bacterium]
MTGPQAWAPERWAVRPTTLVRADGLGARLGCDLTLAVECFQPTGSFKYRAALNVARTVPQERIIAASSGNFGQALALACRVTGKRCTVVMPSTSARVKVDRVLSFGGEVDMVDVAATSRSDRVAQLAADDPSAYLASAYDDDLVIQGNASLGRELADCGPAFDCVVAPVGGGGLTAGLVLGLRERGAHSAVWGAEPALGNDAARSLRSGKIERNAAEPTTLADGARTLSLGERNWAILQHGLAGIVEVPEELIRAALISLMEEANVKCEPTGALALGAVLAEPARFANKRICCVVSGGSVDRAVLVAILSEGRAG